MSFLFVDTLQQATSVTSACVLGRGVTAALLVARHDALHTYTMDAEPASPPLLQHCKSFPLHERIERVVSIPSPNGTQRAFEFLTILADGSVDLLCASSGSTPSTCRLTRQTGCRLQLPGLQQDDMPATLRPEGPACSSALPVQHQQAQLHVCAVAMHHGYLHILKVAQPSTAAGPSHAAAGPTLSATAVHLLDAGLTGAPPPLRTGGSSSSSLPSRVQQDVHVRAVEVMPAPGHVPSTSASGSTAGSTKCLSVLLHQNEGPNASAINLDCLELDWHTGRLSPGPWSCRNVHPTTSLLLPFNPSAQHTPHNSSAAPAQPALWLPGMLVFSSRSLQLFSCAPAPSASHLAQALAAAGGNLATAAMDIAINGPESGSVAAAGSDPKVGSAPVASRTRLLSWELPGVPTCAEWLSPLVLVLGDSMAGLHLISLRGSAAWLRTIQPTGPLCAPSVMRYLPNPPTQQASEAAVHGTGLLFIGSCTSNSQTLLVPSGFDSQPASTPSDNGQKSAPVMQWLTLDPALIKSLAPVQACVSVPDRQRAQDSWLVACCGVAPCGRLASMRLGVSLRPYLTDGPDVPAGVRLFPLRGDPSSPHHTHLAFSFDAAGCTDVLLLQGDSFTQTSLPGLDSGQPSLLLANMPGGHLLQVTSTGARILPACCLSSSSPPPPGGYHWVSAAPSGSAVTLSLAAARGSWVVAVAGTCLHLLHVTATTGALEARHTCSLGSNIQVSALALLHLPHSALGTAPQQQQQQQQSRIQELDGGLYVALGDWSTGSLALSPLLDLVKRGLEGMTEAAGTNDAVLRLQLSSGEIPRSVACLSMEAAASTAGMLRNAAAVGTSNNVMLCVGTNGGAVFVYELQQQQPQPDLLGAPCRLWGVAASRQVRISNVAVELQEVAAAGPLADAQGMPQGAGTQAYIYAHSGCDAIFRLPSTAGLPGASTSTSGPAPLPIDTVEVCRVHGSSGLRAICHISTELMPQSMAWVNREGRLLFGDLEAEQKLRWTTAYIGDTPLHVCYHAASHCLVVVTQDVAGVQWLRLVHADTLRQVLAYRLASGHYVTSLAVEQLPCSSQQLKHLGQGQGQGHSQAKAADGRSRGLAAAADAAAATTAGSAGVGKEFVVLGSYLLYDHALDPTLAPGTHRTQGLLSFFEVTTQVLEAAGTSGGSGAGLASSKHAPAAGGTDVKYALVLHGLCPVPSPMLALVAAHPAPAHTGAASPLQHKAAAQPTAEGGAQRAAPRSQPVLLGGAQDCVYAFHVHVDDCGTDGNTLTQHAARAVMCVEPLPFVVPPLLELDAGQAGEVAPAGGAQTGMASDEDDEEAYLGGRMNAEDAMSEEDHEGDAFLDDGLEQSSVVISGAAASGRASGDAGSRDRGAATQDVRHQQQPRSKKLRRALAAVQRSLQRDWSQHVTLSIAAKAEAFAQAAITTLQAQSDGTIWAGEFLGSVSALQLVCDNQGVGLVPMAVDRHPVFAQSMVALSAEQVLAGVHPRGLLLLQRRRDEEAVFVQQRRQQAMADHEAGERRAPAPSASEVRRQGAAASGDSRSVAMRPDALQLLGIKAQDCPSLQAMASARPCHPVYKMSSCRLGLALAPVALSEHLHQEVAASAGPARAGAESQLAQPPSVLCLASDGAVLRVATVQRNNSKAKALADLQARLQRLATADFAAFTGIKGGRQRHADSWQLELDGSSSYAEAQAAVPLPGTAGVEQVLPGFSVDGALLQLLACQPGDRLQGLAGGLDLQPEQLVTLASLRQL